MIMTGKGFWPMMWKLRFGLHSFHCKKNKTPYLSGSERDKAHGWVVLKKREKIIMMMIIIIKYEHEKLGAIYIIDAIYFY